MKEKPGNRLTLNPFQFGLASLFWLVLLVACIVAVADAAADPPVLVAAASTFIGIAAAAFLFDFLDRLFGRHS